MMQGDWLQIRCSDGLAGAMPCDIKTSGTLQCNESVSGCKGLSIRWQSSRIPNSNLSSASVMTMLSSGRHATHSFGLTSEPARPIKKPRLHFPSHCDTIATNIRAAMLKDCLKCVIYPKAVTRHHSSNIAHIIFQEYVLSYNR